ncbi:hypothetical protein SKAU_G00071750 [Synaphobranchus kaupii]|uniref:SH2 domain-containing protein n=1 Tax=Synaphobranchus kaupii TaxID=118154 RepID=A0A9Q1G8H5_SYNKA|nr:hypothetical protein SKAU_G00071750 [Synaphobranchus kaupii]
MGTLKRRLSAKQKSKAKTSSPSVGCIDDDTFSSSSAPISFNEVKAQRPLRATSLRSHHYSPTPWPLRPANSEETCIKMEVKVKALVHSSNPSPAFNGVRKEFHDLQMEGLFRDPRVGRVYDSIQNSGPMVVTSLTEELKRLAKQGWYWGPITRWEAEEKLVNLADGSFLVRDSSDDRYLLSLSFRSQDRVYRGLRRILLD